MQNFTGTAADSVWVSAVECLRSSATEQASRSGTTLEVLHATLEVADPKQRWVYSRRPALSVAFAVVETIAILNGRTDAAFLTYWNRELPRFVGSSDTLHGAYGYRLRRHFGLDQLENAFLALTSNPDTRQVVLSIWDPISDLPESNGSPRSPDIPCNVCSLLKVRNKKLEWLQVMRSNDVFRGLPYNIVQFTTLQEVIAGWLQLELGSYVHVSDSLHAYGSDSADLFNFSTSWTPINHESLALPKEASDRIWKQMASDVDELIDPTMPASRLSTLAQLKGYPEAHANLMRVVIAEGYRRRGDGKAADSVMSECSNAALVHLWRNWSDRISK